MHIESGRYTVRLANSDEDVAAAQRLRYSVFVEEMGAKPKPEDAELRQERDRFDPFCDHLLLTDNSTGGSVVGVYRLLRKSVAIAPGGPGFYTASEYDLSPMETFNGETLELGRSCVAADYRGTAAMQLLWIALSQYTVEFEIKLMFGAASFHGVDIEPLKVPLSFLHHHHLAPEAIRPRTLPQHYVNMNLLPEEQIDRAEALRMLPALMKGYMRLGGYVGDGAFIDREFNTVDVCLVMDTAKITQRYKDFYARRGGDIERILG
ncbi:MAG: GNAT family N-acyltransferase [Pseudomonadota bacterium]